MQISAFLQFNAFLQFYRKSQLGIPLCAGFPDAPHMFRGLIRALQGLFKTSYKSNFRWEDHTGHGEGRGPG